jgi:glycerol-3-phosphate acyltransferase PlsY
VFFADVLKGFAAVRLAYFLGQRQSPMLMDAEYYGIIAAVLVIIGHTFPVWLRFKGGKGVATSAGAVLGLMPLAAILIFGIWVIVFEITRYVSLASIIAAGGLPFLVLALLRLRITTGIGVLYFASIMSLLILWRHRSNFSRLLAGTEQRFDRK